MFIVTSDHGHGLNRTKLSSLYLSMSVLVTSGNMAAHECIVYKSCPHSCTYFSSWFIRLPSTL